MVNKGEFPMAGCLCFYAKKSLGIDKRRPTVWLEWSVFSIEYLERAIVECLRQLRFHMSPSQG